MIAYFKLMKKSWKELILEFGFTEGKVLLFSLRFRALLKNKFKSSSQVILNFSTNLKKNSFTSCYFTNADLALYHLKLLHTKRLPSGQ